MTSHLAAALEAAPSRVYGLESALAERAVILMDKLSRCTIHPYVLSSASKTGVGALAPLTQNRTTPLNPEDLRNDQGGPFVILHSQAFTVNTTVASANVTAPFSNVAIQVADTDGNSLLGRTAALLPTLYSINSNAWDLYRPYVLKRRSALLVKATEMNVGGGTILFVSFIGETVLGEMSAREVNEAIMLGVYPLPGQQSSVWDCGDVMQRVFGPKPAKLKGLADDVLADLRDRVVILREKLRAADMAHYVVEDGRTNITASGDTGMNRDALRNDQKGPIAFSRAMLFTTSNIASPGTNSLFTNVSLKIESTDEPLRLTRAFAEAPLLFRRSSLTWMLDRGYVVAPRGGLAVTLREGAGASTTDVHLALHGEVVRGVTTRELRAAVALGLYPLIDRNFD